MLDPKIRSDTKLVRADDYLNGCFFKAPGDPVLTADMDTCSEALAQLDDVIMHTFQQCVYHLTKVYKDKSQQTHIKYITCTVSCFLFNTLILYFLCDTDTAAILGRLYHVNFTKRQKTVLLTT